MYTTKFVSLAFVGTAAAFNPMMQMSTGRRAAIQGAGAAAIAAPLLRPEGAEAAFPGKMTTNPPAPYITILDHRGCSRYSTEYTGPRANAMEDEQCVKLESKITAVSTDEAAAFLRGVLGSFNA